MKSLVALLVAALLAFALSYVPTATLAQPDEAAEPDSSVEQPEENCDEDATDSENDESEMPADAEDNSGEDAQDKSTDAADDGTQLFDLLKQPAYLAAWKALLMTGKAPPWLATFATPSGEGVTPDASSIGIGTETYTMAEVWEAHSGGDNYFYVLFAPGGEKAWGLLLERVGEEEQQHEEWFGSPSPEIRTAILNHCHSDLRGVCYAE